ncbi:hypothetical protein VTK73DRAFT_8203 [Phialemonium thermophilum]|uniref:Uncharacterized protein n=1 Tax=Phialemonium thermophilum TaxID=223376 RepID=A0ABR3W9N7_9PEZI
MAYHTEPPRRRFAPVPIETTFERFRKTGPAPEPTPSPSPRSASPPSPPPYREKRRFAPQLVESSVRRSRRAGDDGPATRPTDKTDITPYTNHIYAPRAKRRHDLSKTREDRMALARRESCDDEVADGVFDLLAREAQRKLQEVAMTAFPHSNNVRIGGAEHFYVREGSDDDSVESRGRPMHRSAGRVRHSRRNSSTEDISWAFKEMQEHVSRLQMAPERISTMDLDNMSIDGPPSDAMGLTRAQRASLTGSPLWSSSRGSLDPVGDHHTSYAHADSHLPTIGESALPYSRSESPEIRPIGETFMPYIPSAPAGKAAHMPYAPASQIPPETGFGGHRPAPSPFSPFHGERDMSLERLRNLHRLKASHSPPLLGDDLVFRMCPSPEMTKLEPDHLWDLQKGATAEDPNRDTSEEHGLWRGYCYTSDKTENLIPADRPAMISTPHPLLSPGDPFARAFSMSIATDAISEEPQPVQDRSRTAKGSPARTANSTLLGVPGDSRGRGHGHEPKGLHMLQGLEERLRKEKEAADLEEKIVGEFDDAFVTQVYNYLSLGYPATARAYDEELSKISHISIEELERDDDAVLDSMFSGDVGGCGGAGADGVKTPVNGARARKGNVTGHIMLDSEEKQGVPEEQRTPRWRALKKYIYEWARQHPDLDAISPLAWGVQERRGSWGL